MRILLFLVLCTLGIKAQDVKTLLYQYKTAKTDSEKINRLNSITEIYIERESYDSASMYNKLSIEIATKRRNETFAYKSLALKSTIEKKNKQFDAAFKSADIAHRHAIKSNNLSHQANAIILKGSVFDLTNKNDSALIYYLKAFEISKRLNDKKELLSANLALGLYFKKLSKTTDALSSLIDALKIGEEIKDSAKIFTACINLGSLYERTNDFEKAKSFYHKALIINSFNKDENDRAIVCFKIGRLYRKLLKNDSAEYYLAETLKIHQKRDDKPGLVLDYSNLGGFYEELGEYNSAEEYYLKAVDLGKTINDSLRINLIYSYLGGFYQKQKKYQKALESYNTGLKYVTSELPNESLIQQYGHLSEIYFQLGNFKEAYLSHVQFKALSDSTFNVNETKKQTELKLNYEFEQIQKRIEDETKAKELLSKAELEKERLQRNYLLIGLAVISIMLIVTIKNYRAKQKANHILEKQKKEIERQKKIVEEKNNEINDSINYAQRIQTASIPNKSELTDYFNNCDLLFKPKDVVSGDFYWAAKNETHSFMAVADCTGHGVPGAITSMIGSMLLNEIFYVKKITQPNEVLTELNRLVKLTLRQESDTTSNDGMDIGFCALNRATNELLFAGANRPMYLVNLKGELLEYKPSKASVGGYVPLIQNYDLHKIQLQKGDTVVITTDGYADQFGGDREKKFTTKAFKSIITQNAHLSAKELATLLETSHNQWKGNNEQTDDVLVFVLKV